MVGLEDLSLALAGARSDEMKLLLAHNPVILRRAARASVDLVLSGHTHGGQVAIRGERSASGRPRRRLLKGLGRQGDTQIYVNRGWVPWCYPSDTDALLKSLCWNSEATSKRDPRDRSVLTDIENVRAHHHCSQPSYCLPDGFDSGIRLLLFYQRFVLALAVFIFAGITDGLDGLLARRFDQKSQLGTILDPIADKLLLVTAFVVLSMRAVFPQPLPSHLPVPFWVTVAVISRDVFILVGAAAINIVTGFRGFRPSMLGKVNTFVQIVAIGADHLRRQLSLRHRLLPPDGLHDRLRLRRPFRRPLRLFRLQTRKRGQIDTQQNLTTTHSGLILAGRSSNTECKFISGLRVLEKKEDEQDYWN